MTPAWFLKYFGKMSPMYIDGWLYVLIAMFGGIAASLNSDEAAKYVADWLLFWLRETTTWICAGLLALKMYRSTTYAEHIKEVNKQTVTNNTTVGNI